MVAVLMRTPSTLLFNTRETVEGATPARRATSRIPVPLAVSFSATPCSARRETFAHNPLHHYSTRYCRRQWLRRRGRRYSGERVLSRPPLPVPPPGADIIRCREARAPKAGEEHDDTARRDSAFRRMHEHPLICFNDPGATNVARNTSKENRQREGCMSSIAVRVARAFVPLAVMPIASRFA